MTPFEFVFGMISVITSLALVQIVTGVVELIRHHDRHGLSGLHALWVVIAFMLILSNWASFWPLREGSWSSLPVFTALVTMILLYAFAALVIPESRDRKLVDLSTFHEKEGRRYIAAHALFAAVSIFWGFAYYGFALPVLGESIPGLVALVLSLIALALFKVRWVQWWVAILTVLNTAWMMWPTIAISA